MKPTTIHQLAQIMSGQVIGDGDLPFSSLFTDSRATTGTQNTFLCLTGKRFDGHEYVTELFEKGVRSFIVEKDIPLEGATFIQVPNTLVALQLYAQWHREQFEIPVIGITGSNGKTIIKEWLSQLLSNDTLVVKSPKSYNSQVGVPLSVLQIQEHHEIGIFEAGISEKGEMEKLERMIQPTIGIVTNLGAAHDEGFVDRQEKLTEKLKLFGNSTVIIGKKDVLLAAKNALLWEYTGNNVFNCNNIEFQFAPPFTSEAYLENLGHCMAVMTYLGYSAEYIKTKINQLRSLPMRLEVKLGKGNSIVVNDSYNADLNALEIALEYGRQLHATYPLTLIVSDMPQTGLTNAEMVAAIESVADKMSVDRVITIGPATKKFRQRDAYTSTGEFIADLEDLDFREQVVVLKGARAFEFERISQQLELQQHETVWEINLSALTHNLNLYRSHIKTGTKVMAMVKALAYGSGDKEIAQLLQHQKVDYLGVAFAEEGIALRQAGITLPILVLNAGNTAFSQLVQYELEPETYSLQHLKSLLDFLKAEGISQFPVHIKLDTGMHRLGFEEKDIPELLHLITNQDQVHITGIMTHLAASEDKIQTAFTDQQLVAFKRMAGQISNSLGYRPLKHALNSAGIINFPHAQLDMVRLGIGLYGIDTAATLAGQLIQIGTLKSRISQIKELRAGDTVGYGRSFAAARSMTMATVPIGYADGVDRRLSNGKGYVLIKGNKAPIIGNVCMDMLMIDITNIPTQVGAEVIITAPELPLSTIASNINTIPYELLTNISPRIQRVYVYE